MISSGSSGMVMKESTTSITSRSKLPPMNPALSPTAVEMIITPVATSTPRISELRMANTRNQKMSCPSALVPNRWPQDIGMFLR